MSRNARVSILITARENARSAITAVRRQLQQLEASSASFSQRASTGMRGWVTQMRAATPSAVKLKGLLGGLGGALAAIGVTTGMAAVLGWFLGVNRETQRLKAQLKTLEGSRSGANAVFRQIQQFAKETPFEVAEVTRAYMDLRASGIQPTQEMLTSFGDLASARGKSITDFSAAVQDAMTGEMERLKEFGIVTAQQGNKVRVTFNGQTTTIARTREAMLAYLESVGRTKGVQGAMGDQMVTIDGALSNLWDSLAAVARQVGGDGGPNTFNGAIVSAIQWVTGLITKLGENGAKIRWWTGVIVASVRFILSIASALMTGIWTGFASFGDLLALVVASLDLKVRESVNKVIRTVNTVTGWLEKLKLPGIEIELTIAEFDEATARARVDELRAGLGERRDALARAGERVAESWRGISAASATSFVEDSGRSSWGSGTTVGGSLSGAGAGESKKQQDLLGAELDVLKQIADQRAFTAAELERVARLEERLGEALRRNLAIQTRTEEVLEAEARLRGQLLEAQDLPVVSATGEVDTLKQLAGQRPLGTDELARATAVEAQLKALLEENLTIQERTRDVVDDELRLRQAITDTRGLQMDSAGGELTVLHQVAQQRPLGTEEVERAAAVEEQLRGLLEANLAIQDRTREVVQEELRLRDLLGQAQALPIGSLQQQVELWREIAQQRRLTGEEAALARQAEAALADELQRRLDALRAVDERTSQSLREEADLLAQIGDLRRQRLDATATELQRLVDMQAVRRLDSAELARVAELQAMITAEMQNQQGLAPEQVQALREVQQAAADALRGGLGAFNAANVWDAMRDAALAAAGDVADGWAATFQRLSLDARGVGQLLKGIWQATAAGAMNAVAAEATGRAGLNLVAAAEQGALAIGALAGANPAKAALHAKSAAMHLATAAAWSALAGGAGSLAGGGGSGGGGRGAGGAPGGGGGASGRRGAEQDADRLRDQGRGEAVLAIQGGLLDMSDPRQESALAHALETLSGRRVRIRR